MERDPRAYLWDVQQAAEAIGEFIVGQDAASYPRNKLVRAAVERQFGIIGDALNRLAKVSPALAARVPHLAEIVAFRNVLIHGYAVIDHGRVWNNAQAKREELHAAVSALLEELGPP